MSDNVISLEAAREERTPHLSGTLYCVGCQHKAVLVIPLSMALDWVECPACRLLKAKLFGKITEADTQHWTCNCGNDLFHVTPEHAYCPNCGAEQNFPMP